MLLNANTLNAILHSGEKLAHELANYFGLVLDLVAIQRSQGSSIRLSDGTSLPLKDMFKPIHFRTASVELSVEERMLYQAFHGTAAKYV